MIELVAYQCKKCGRVMYPRHSRCLRCHGRELEPIQATGEAILVTFTEVYVLSGDIDEKSRTLGIAEFENKVRAMGWIKVAQPKLGMKLRANWEPVRLAEWEPVYGLTFEAK